MTEQTLAQPARARHWVLDAMAGAAVALCAMTVAHAALPETPVRRPVAAAAVVLAPVAVPPPVLIAFRDPVPGEEIVSPFGFRQLPWEEHGRLHAGVDIAADTGAPIVASADGVVTAAGDSDSYGRFVEVKHAEGLSTFYAHMGAIGPGIAPGVAVKAGVAVGKIGSSGTSTGPHLHFEIRDSKDRPLNPALFLDRSFASADDLPIRAAARTPRRVRIAYVSAIPASKRVAMAAKLERQAQAKVARAQAQMARADLTATAPAAAAATDAAQPAASQVGAAQVGADGRPHAQLTL